MSRIVFDTNVIISALLFDGVPEVAILNTLAGGHTGITSPFIIEETSRILHTKFNIAPTKLSLLQQLLASMEVYYFQPFLDVLGDNPDNRILETAIQGKADSIITGDKLLLELEHYESIAIVTPATFLANDL